MEWKKNTRSFLKKLWGHATNYKHCPCLCCLFIQEIIREVGVLTDFENKIDLNTSQCGWFNSKAENINN